MKQEQYEATGAGVSQADLILRRLIEARGEWVPMPELVRVSGAFAVHSRIADLRRAGWQIEQESVHRQRRVHSFYRLHSPSGGAVV